MTSRRLPKTSLAAALVLVSIGSCAQDEPDRPVRHPAAGRILVDGRGEAGIKIRLHPSDRMHDVDALQPGGVTDAEGAYTLGTFEHVDGAPAGRYMATLFWPDSPDPQSRPGDRFAGKYASPETSGFEFTISEGENRLADIKVTRPAPAAKSRPSPRRRPPNFGPGPDGPASD